MKERPILFSGPMVRAILEGRKTQTRRIVKDPPGWTLSNGRPPFSWREVPGLICPYGNQGDRLWVRETWQACEVSKKMKMADRSDIWYRSTDQLPPHLQWKSPIHMPRWASRILLEITDVRVQRVRQISEKDAQAEGVQGSFDIYDAPGGRTKRGHFFRPDFKELWEKINGLGSWERNPWVWAITFKRV